MIKHETLIKDLFIIEPKVYEDERGYFMESFKNKWFYDNISKTKFIQENESKSTYGVLRGLHFQTNPCEQSKLVRVIKGKVLDVVVDLRINSSTFGKTFSIILSEKNKKQMFVPRGFAHGFLVLSKKAIFSYKVDQIYSPNHELGIIWNDNKLNIDWKINKNDIILSKKDQSNITFDKYIQKYL